MKKVTLLCVVLVAACTGAHAQSARTTMTSMMWQRLLRKTWRDVTRQIDITVRHHERQDYNALYKEIKTASSRGRGIVPAWIPGKGDLYGLKCVTLTHNEAVFYLLKLHRDLQKFDTIMEDVARGEDDSPAIKYMMVSTRNFLHQLQREVEKALVALQIGVPPSQMVLQEISQPDAARTARDWGVLNRYLSYLQQWLKLWCAGLRRRRRAHGGSSRSLGRQDCV